MLGQCWVTVALWCWGQLLGVSARSQLSLGVGFQVIAARSQLAKVLQWYGSGMLNGITFCPPRSTLWSFTDRTKKNIRGKTALPTEGPFWPFCFAKLVHTYTHTHALLLPLSHNWAWCWVTAFALWCWVTVALWRLITVRLWCWVAVGRYRIISIIGHNSSWGLTLGHTAVVRFGLG